MDICLAYLAKQLRVNSVARIVDINGKVLEKGESIRNIFITRESL